MFFIEKQCQAYIELIYVTNLTLLQRSRNVITVYTQQLYNKSVSTCLLSATEGITPTTLTKVFFHSNLFELIPVQMLTLCFYHMHGMTLPPPLPLNRSHKGRNLRLDFKHLVIIVRFIYFVLLFYCPFVQLYYYIIYFLLSD